MNVSAIIITEVAGIGTLKEDSLAYVDCLFNNGEQRAIAFTREMASTVVTAFLAASGHLERRQAIKDRTGRVPMSRPLPISDAAVAIGKTDNEPDQIALMLSTQSGAVLNVSLSQAVIRKIAAGLAAVLETAGKKPPEVLH
jgi:hypothetical protein